MRVALELWVGVVALIFALVAVDLLDERRHGSRSLGRATTASVVWVLAAVAFGGAVWIWAGSSWAAQYFTGYLTEKALSVDNLFVFAVILDTLAVPAAARQRVLRWGVIGALVARAVLIVAGVSLLEQFGWASYLLGAVVVVAGVRLVLRRDHEREGRLLRGAKRHLAVDTQTDNGAASRRFFVRHLDMDGRVHLRATPLLLALVVIEVTDVAFAVDSVPAVLSLTREPFLVFTSNAFAVLGLRSLYFVVAGVLGRLRYLDVGLAVILVLVGTKMLVTELWTVPLWAALAAIGSTLAVTTVVSLLHPASRASPPSKSVVQAAVPGTAGCSPIAARRISEEPGRSAPGSVAAADRPQVEGRLVPPNGHPANGGDLHSTSTPAAPLLPRGQVG